jgi:hypothetical protein
MPTKTLLYNSTDCARWKRALDEYAALVAAHAVNQLAELDLWYSRDLPPLLASRTPPHVTKEEFLEVLRWKMKRGDWREGNRLRIAGTEGRVIKKAAEEALVAAGTLPADVATGSKEFKYPVQRLSELDGVGPATASAVLAPFRPDLYPFFDEWIAKQIPQLGKVAFTPAYYWRYAEALRSKAAELTKRCRETWTAHDVGQALWVASGGKVKIK